MRQFGRLGAAPELLAAWILTKIESRSIADQGFPFDLASGNDQVYFVVRDNVSGRIGSVIVPLTVN